MNSDRWTPEQIFVYRHPVDMRKQIDGLANLVSSQLLRDPSDRSLYRNQKGSNCTVTHQTGRFICLSIEAVIKSNS